MKRAPAIDGRKAEDILRQLRSLQGREYNRNARGPDEALARIFARYCEILIDRLNRAPEKSFVAFLDMLGVSLLPAQPARVALTFFPAARTDADVVVPALTQVGAEPVKGDKEPVIFETERELVLLSANLDSLFIREGARGLYADYGRLLKEPGSDSVAAFRGNEVIPHILYVGIALPAATPVFSAVHLIFTFDSEIVPPAPQPWLSWELWDGVRGQPIAPSSDSTAGLRRSGEVVFENLPQLVASEVDGVRAQWIRCRMLSAFEPRPEASFPPIRRLRVRTVIQRTGLPFDNAFYNAVPLDLTKEFLPFGEAPRFADTLYLASEEAFASPRTEIVVQFQVANPSAGGPDIPAPPVTNQDVKLRWEMWNGSEWAALDRLQFQDETAAFSRTGTVRFRLPGAVARTVVNGIEQRWIRVRILSGSYGQSARYEATPASPTPIYRPAIFSPPVLRAVNLTYELTDESQPESVVVFNDFAHVHLSTSSPDAAPFVPAQDPDPACYLGFDTSRFSSGPVSIFIGVSYPIRSEGWPQDIDSSAALASWQYWNGTHWTDCSVVDDTMGLRRSGVLRFLPAPDFLPKAEFGRERFWIRVHRHGSQAFEPRLTMVLLNTTMASQTFTTENEILGSSNGRPFQKMHCSRTPVLGGEQLDVLERNEHGKEEWITWRPVGSFHACGPLDRVYILNHATGEVLFGDAAHGAIPPVQTSNIRMTKYQTGGGPVGNRRALSITQLKTTVPYVDKVTNYQRASGGAAAETISDLLERGPRELRHRNRSVTVEDYEDLARRSTGEVARAGCVPLIDLARDRAEAHPTPGVVGMIIVPHSAEPAPVPSLELLDRVRRYIEDRQPPGVRLVLVGPDYVRVDIDTQVTVTNMESARQAEGNVRTTLAAYLHPVTGREGKGWPFGTQPKSSDVYAVIESVPGVEHVRSLQVRADTGPAQGKRFLVFAGEIRVKALLES